MVMNVYVIQYHLIREVRDDASRQDMYRAIVISSSYN